MMWFALLFITIGWEYITGVFVPPRPGLSCLLFICGSLVLAHALWQATQVEHKKTRFLWTLANLLTILFSTSIFQFLFLRFYFWLAPHYHSASFLTLPTQFLLQLLGLETSAYGEFIYLQTFSSVIPFSMTFEKLGLPSLCSFLLMGWITLLWFRQKHWGRLFLELGLIIGGYAILRVVALILLFADGGEIGLFWHPIWIGLSLLPLVAILTYFYPLSNMELLLHNSKTYVTKRCLKVYGLMFLCFLLLVLVFSAEEPGIAKSGKVLVDEVYSDWEWTTIPFNKELYGKQTTYNYYCLRTWLNHYYTVSVNTERELTSNLLNQYDILIIKTPTTAFFKEELAAIKRFVKEGGGLFLIGDHTNLYGMTTYINPVSQLFGITFLSDDTFDLTSGQPSFYRPPILFAHPTVHHIPKFRFMTSCTLMPPLLRSRTTMLGARLGRENIDYSHMNFFGNIKADINDEYGVFIQSAALSFGKGRVVAFSDSTVFSNFSMFFEGTPELALGIMEFLNRKNRQTYTLLKIFLVAISALGVLVVFMLLKRNHLKEPPFLIMIVSFVLFGSILVGNLLSTGLNALNYKLPLPHTPYTRIYFDQSISYYRLPGLIDRDSDNSEIYFDSFYTAIQRLGHYPALTPSLNEATSTGDVVVIINPRKTLDSEHLLSVQKFLQEGGKLLILENTGKNYRYAEQFAALGKFSIREGGERISIPTEFQTGQSFQVIRKKVGSGDIVIVLGAEQLSRQFMGPTHSNPTDEQKLKYRLAYFLLEEVLQITR